VIACNGTIVNDSEMGEVIQLQGDQRKDVQEFLVDKNGLELDAKTIKVSSPFRTSIVIHSYLHNI
jgi:translation initiation factor SUI1